MWHLIAKLLERIGPVVGILFILGVCVGLIWAIGNDITHGLSEDPWRTLIMSCAVTFFVGVWFGEKINERQHELSKQDQPGDPRLPW